VTADAEPAGAQLTPGVIVDDDGLVTLVVGLLVVELVLLPVLLPVVCANAGAAINAIASPALPMGIFRILIKYSFRTPPSIDASHLPLTTLALHIESPGFALD
jgi:hypothetical protein